VQLTAVRSVDVQNSLARSRHSENRSEQDVSIGDVRIAYCCFSCI
jgi:hypothetical protein